MTEAPEQVPELKEVRTVLADDRLLDKLYDVYHYLWTLMNLVNLVIPKCPRCREPLHVQLREAERGVYTLVLVCSKCGLELVSSSLFSRVRE